MHLTPAAVTFSPQYVSTTSAAKTFTLISTDLVTNIAIAATGDFAVSATTCGTRLAPKSNCTIDVIFTPSAAGKRTGQLSVSDSIGNENPQTQTASLTGTGVAAKVTLTPGAATYAKQGVGTTSAAKTFTLSNAGPTLNNIVISTTGDFAVSATTCGTSLGGKSASAVADASVPSCTISVTFAPTDIGTRTGQLVVSDSASDSPQTANLTGTGK